MSRPRTHALPDIAELHYRYIYDPTTGTFTHRPRVGADKLVQTWNLRYAGKIAGTVQNSGYWFLNVARQCLLGHRVAWAMTHGEWPGELDHRDGDKLNNSIANLRIASRKQNIANRPGRALSGFKGVTARGKRWYGAFCHGGRFVHLGTFDSPELAHAAYQGAARVFYGEFANMRMTAFGAIAATVQIMGVAHEGCVSRAPRSP